MFCSFFSFNFFNFVCCFKGKRYFDKLAISLPPVRELFCCGDIFTILFFFLCCPFCAKHGYVAREKANIFLEFTEQNLVLQER